MSQSFNLYQLERIDTRKDQLFHRAEQIQKEIDDRSRIDLLDNSLKDLEAKREDLLDRVGDLDQDIQNKKIKINQSESSLYGGKVQNPKELQALQTEIDSLSKYVAEKEASLSSMMSDFESIERDLIQTQTDLEEELSAKEKQINQLMLEKTNILKDLEKVESERLVAVSQIKAGHLNTYEEIRKKKKNIAVTIVEDDTCSACGVSITPSEWQAARSPDVVVFCPSCSRILYAG
jgi:predicted  nucleic acid-binding Zn-ribbon protein